MYRLSQIALVILFPVLLFSQNPHGNDFNFDCAKCHTSDSWKVDLKNVSFEHEITGFNLNGRHGLIDCNECHVSMVFSEVKKECVDCHADIHNNTVSLSCDDCHGNDDWIIEDITVVHEQSGFPLLGLHQFLDCSECHNKSVELIFEPLSIECYSCHKQNYANAESPNHIEENFPFECYQCHELEAETWIISHDFFPLEKGHDINQCSICHDDNNYLSASPDCYNCHSENYDNASNPDHKLNSFSKDCSECHTIDPDWTPAEYKVHDDRDFPIYSGKHEGEWSLCIDCHLNPDDYSIFTCIDCHKHEKTKMDEEHDEESGYVYESQACFKCHPDGDK